MIFNLPWMAGSILQPFPTFQFDISQMFSSRIEDYEPPIVLEPGQTANWSIIWLHGLGADGRDFEPIASQLALGPNVFPRFVFPHAPMRPITVNGGMRMRGWYDIRAMDVVSGEDRDGIRQSADFVEDLVKQESEIVGPGRVILAGFSQGGAIALYLAQRGGISLAAVLAMSTYLPECVQAPGSAGSSRLPVFLAHGSLDPVVPFFRGADARAQLESRGFEVHWRDYPIPHAVSPEEINDISVFLSGVMRAA